MSRSCAARETSIAASVVGFLSEPQPRKTRKDETRHRERTLLETFRSEWSRPGLGTPFSATMLREALMMMVLTLRTMVQPQ